MTFKNRGEGGRLAAFLANGGGVITFRVALSVLGAITLFLLESFGTHIVSQLDGLASAQARMASMLAVLGQQGRDTAALAARNADRLDDQEHRITVLEARSPRPGIYP